MCLKQQIIENIELFLQKKISLKKLTAELNKEKEYLLSLSNKGTHTEIAYNIYFSPNTICDKCGDLMKFYGFSKGYKCTKKCENDKLLDNITKNDVIKEIRKLYDIYNKPKTGDINFKKFSQLSRKYIKKFWPDNKFQMKLLYDIIYPNDKENLCFICGKNKVKFSSTKFEYSTCCSKSCMTKYQMKYLSPWDEERKTRMVEQIKKTKTERYGNYRYNNSEKSKETRLKNNNGVWFTQEQLYKRNKTCLEKYGVDNVSKNEKIKQKVNDTTLKRYGVSRFPNIDYKAIRKRMENLGYWIKDEDKKDFELYSFKVRKLTEKQPLHLLENYDKRGPVEKEGSYHLDHKVSIYNGFINNIPIYIISNIKNLEMIPSKDNIKKNKKSSITIEELINSIEVSWNN